MAVPVLTASEGDKSHYTHIEDELYVSGRSGVAKIITSFTELVSGIPSTVTQTKIDGNPSIFYGYHATNGKFFVATKSIFNVDPKVNHTAADIDKNHGHAPGLVKKLKHALKYLPSITANKSSIMQGDYMFAKEDLEKADIEGIPHFLFKPNVVVNAVAVDSDYGKQIASAEIGFAPHTKYTSAGDRVTISSGDIGSNSKVFIMPINAPALSGMATLTSLVNTVKSKLSSLSASGLTLVSSEKMSKFFLEYANYVIRTDTAETFDGLLSFIEQKLQKEVDKVKTEKTKMVKMEYMNDILDTIKKKKIEVESILAAHTYVAVAKNKVVAELDKKQPIRRFFKNEMGALIKTNPEGYVTLNQSGTAKFINRAEFSKQNFLMGAAWKKEAAATKAVVAQAKPLNEKTITIVPLGRFNPPHNEHANLINAVLALAAKTESDARIFVSRSTDNKKNPLTADEKIRYLKKMYPGKNNLFDKPPQAKPNITGSMTMLSGKYDVVNVVLGASEIALAKTILTKYNGKDYTFKQINFFSRQEITKTQNDGDDGVHASDIRKWAIEGDFKKVKASMSSKLSDIDVKTIMSLIKTRIK